MIIIDYINIFINEINFSKTVACIIIFPRLTSLSISYKVSLKISSKNAVSNIIFRTGIQQYKNNSQIVYIVYIHCVYTNETGTNQYERCRETF